MTSLIDDQVLAVEAQPDRLRIVMVVRGPPTEPLRPDTHGNGAGSCPRGKKSAAVPGLLRRPDIDMNGAIDARNRAEPDGRIRNLMRIAALAIRQQRRNIPRRQTEIENLSAVAIA